MQKKMMNLLAMLLGAWPFLLAQQPVDSFPEQKARDLITVLAGDSLRGRGNMTEDLLKAGKFIISEFKGSGLIPLPGSNDFFHAFQPFGGANEKSGEKLEWNSRTLDPDDFIYLAVEPGSFALKDLSAFTVIHVDSFSGNVLKNYNDSASDLLIWTESPVTDWSVIMVPAKGLRAARLLVHANEPPRFLSLSVNENYYRSLEYNVAGMIPGRSKPQECIIFSSHYDHEGIVKGRDSIMNGANDNASGTTVLMMLARYFAMRNDNERTLIFCAFAGEEIGLKGSGQMSKLLVPSRLKAGINLEMLGFPQYGRKKVYITGEKYSSLPSILKKGLVQNGVKVMREPAEEKMLFARSDNYPFVLKGVPFHTIMASDDDERCYHKPCDEVKRMDIPNLCFLSRAIASACAGLISGEETPGKLTLPDWKEH